MRAGDWLPLLALSEPDWRVAETEASLGPEPPELGRGDVERGPRQSCRTGASGAAADVLGGEQRCRQDRRRARDLRVGAEAIQHAAQGAAALTRHQIRIRCAGPGTGASSGGGAQGWEFEGGVDLGGVFRAMSLGGGHQGAWLGSRGGQGPAVLRGGVVGILGARRVVRELRAKGLGSSARVQGPEMGAGSEPLGSQD